MASRVSLNSDIFAYSKPPIYKTQNTKIKLPLLGSARSISNKTLAISSSRSSHSPNSDSSLSKHSMMKKYNMSTTTPHISASSCCIYDTQSCKIIFHKNSSEIKEIASLGKILTCLLCLKLCKDYKISIDSPVIISRKASRVGGTSANLLEDSILSIRSLLYGLMLPSGNDAAWALAEYFGGFIYVTTKPVKYFIEEMNNLARDLQLTCTHFKNPHGLTYKRNVSSARDAAVLSAAAMKDPVFREIVNCREYSAEVSGSDNEITRQVWKNTNILLSEGFEGIKTGVTSSAGPCLCAYYEKYIIVLLHCKSMHSRWNDARKLAQWAQLQAGQEIIKP